MCFFQRHRLAHVLAQIGSNCRHHLNGLIQLWVTAGLVGSNLNQVTASLVRGIALFERMNCLDVTGFTQLRQEATDRAFGVDGRVLPLLGQSPRQHDVAIEDGPNEIPSIWDSPESVKSIDADADPALCFSVQYLP